MNYQIHTSYLLVVLMTFFSFQLLAQGGRTPIPSKNGMVVSSHYLASQVGKDILAKGGNAIDAAVGTAFALAVTLPSAGNIGGGGFLVYHGANGEQTTFNFREKAPKAATQTMYLDKLGKVKNNSNHRGPLSVGVPGTVAGLWDAHQKMGVLPWADLVQPAVDLAEKGFPSTWAMQRFLKRMMKETDAVYDATKKAFLKNGQLYTPGELWKQPDLAATLKRIQKDGRDGFYKGKTAQLIADFMKEHGGLITEADLAAYQPTEQKPIHGTYKGYDIYGMPPPSSGGVAIVEMLNILEGFNLEDLGHNSALYLHILTEVMRTAFADRAEHIGDPLFNPSMPIEKLISKPYADELRPHINWFKAIESDSANFNQNLLVAESEETTHFSVVDQAGNAVSLTYTLEQSYGSKITVAGAGFLLNNEMGDFNPIPGLTNTKGLIGTTPNLIAPEKRMLSSMSPTIVAKNGKPILVIGSPGGRTIINTTLQVILNVIDHKMTVAEAIEAPRIHHQWLPDITSFEKLGISPDTRKMYEMMGHKIRYRGTQGRAMGIFVDYKDGIIYGAADSRSFDGKAVGY